MRWIALNALLIMIISQVGCKQPILELPISLSSDGMISTTFSIGKKRAKMHVQIGEQDIQICCYLTTNIFQQVFHFITNPFFQIEDYACQGITAMTQEGKYKDSATFSRLGLLQISFEQIVYPKCNAGLLGLNQNSTFLALLPKQQQFYIITSTKQSKSISNFKIIIGGTQSNEGYIYVNALAGNGWKMQIPRISYNDNDIGGAQISLITHDYAIFIPEASYSAIMHQLLTQYQCVFRNGVIYCPCQTGISNLYPKFVFYITNNFTISIMPSLYMIEESQICKTLLKEGPQWMINVLLFDKIDIKFDHMSDKIGFLPKLPTPENKEIIKLPIQLILNCFVILLMCVFVSMILIELIKRFSGVGDVPEETFENYMLKRGD